MVVCQVYVMDKALTIRSALVTIEVGNGPTLPNPDGRAAHLA